jgi:hypothetical protein
MTPELGWIAVLWQNGDVSYTWSEPAPRWMTRGWVR